MVSSTTSAPSVWNRAYPAPASMPSARTRTASCGWPRTMALHGDRVHASKPSTACPTHPAHRPPHCSPPPTPKAASAFGAATATAHWDAGARAPSSRGPPPPHCLHTLCAPCYPARRTHSGSPVVAAGSGAWTRWPAPPRPCTKACRAFGSTHLPPCLGRHSWHAPIVDSSIGSRTAGTLHRPTPNCVGAARFRYGWTVWVCWWAPTKATWNWTMTWHRCPSRSASPDINRWCCHTLWCSLRCVPALAICGWARREGWYTWIAGAVFHTSPP